MDLYQTILAIISKEVSRIKSRSDEDSLYHDDIKRLDLLIKAYTTCNLEISRATNLTPEQQKARVKEALDILGMDDGQ